MFKDSLRLTASQLRLCSHCRNRSIFEKVTKLITKSALVNIPAKREVMTEKVGVIFISFRE
ncbi:hypothetical protein BCT30_02385 [Enterovibrio norvegicus]|nr:hypothetical protein A1OS_00390 [Enterovibrio norvegicus]OEF48799.1 hypothetical protein A1OW_14155 [Enterovibrio norvegicus]OEF56331.1 hypothetical protein A1OU_16320 [Enterovibrio norvegicus]PMH65311.1 hypothetical protein BCU62_13410 [Enterovibrio norvegicus]PMI33202.1 hypothetical protein BCU46_03750 [Enterovibrio norvegicus]